MFAPGGFGDGNGDRGGDDRRGADHRRDDDEKEKEGDPDREDRRLREEAARLLASRPDLMSTLRNVPRAAVLTHRPSQPSAPTGDRRNQERPAPNRIDDEGNLQTLKAWLAHFRVDPASGEYTKVLHYCAANYDNSEMDKAIAHIRQRYEQGYQPPQDPRPQQQQQQVTAPPEQRLVVAGVTVVVQSRAFRHIPPSGWAAFLAIINSGSYAQKIQDARHGITEWYEVMSTSDEQFTFGSRTAGIRIMASWNARERELVVYHAHPDIPSYGTYF